MKVLVLDDEKYRHEAFGNMLVGHYVVHAYTTEEATRALQSSSFDLCFLDHDLGEYVQEMYGKVEITGQLVAKRIADLPREKRPGRVIIHSWNESGAKKMASLLAGTGIAIEIRPFGPSWVK